MRRLHKAIVTVAALGLGTGLTFALFHARKYVPPALCEMRSFDHVSFLSLLRSTEQHDEERLASLNSDALAAEKRDFFSARMALVRAERTLVEHFFASNGTTYDCMKPEYGFLMNTLDFPTFRGLDTQQQADRIWKDAKAESEKAPWLELYKATIAPVVTFVVAFWLGKGKSKDEAKT